MALTASFIDGHISTWERRLDLPRYAHRIKWPSRLFHHAPLENAVSILKDGHLRSRNDALNIGFRDIAAPGVIDARAHAHDSARLYFRPRTPTQWHIEGVRKPGECSYGHDAHAPVLVMMVFDAREVLSQPDIRFCDRNMQLGDAEVGSTEKYFSSIPFEKVYHEGGTGGDRTIINHRCAEVLASSPLPLNKSLQWIYCRSNAERDTLLHFLGAHKKRWANRIQISDDLLVFEKKYTFVEEISLSNEGVIFRLHTRQDFQQVTVEIRVWSKTGEEITNFYNAAMAATPTPPYRNWIHEVKLRNGTYLVEVILEGKRVYRSYLNVGNSLI